MGYVGRIGPWYAEGWPALEVGWTLRSSHWGRGYATEAARASIDFAFTDLGADTVISLMLPENTRSSAVARRAGERRLEDTILPHPGDRAIQVYGLTREEWRAS